LSDNDDIQHADGLAALATSSVDEEWSDADKYWMRQALDLARAAASAGEVPVGAVVVRNDEVLATGHNRPITNHDPSAHAELVALRAAALKVENYRLVDTCVYVTLEPCAMCAGAMVHARVGRVVAATPDPRAGAAGSVVDLFRADLFNHNVDYRVGLFAQESADLLRSFFRARRNGARVRDTLG
jgi:tRNA(adenine34) deaminase